MRQDTLTTPSRNYFMDPIRLFSELNGMFEEPLTMRRMMLPLEENYWPMKPWSPPCDIFETEKDLVLKFELPGVKLDDVKVTMEHNVLILKGERVFKEESKRENYHRVERHYGEFTRSFTVPMFVDATKINAEFKHGVLTVTLPKREETKPKEIAIKGN